MKTKLIFTLFLGTFTYGLLMSQFQIVTDAKTVKQFNDYQPKAGLNHPRFNNPHSGVDGSPYLFRDFIIGEAISTDNTRYINANFRYNMYTDQIEYEKYGEVYILNNPGDFEYFILGDHILCYRLFSTPDGLLKKGYFQLLNKGEDAVLFKKKNVRFVPPKEAEAYAPASPAKFMSASDSYYISFQGRPLVMLNLKKKEFLTVFPEKSNEIEKYIANEKLSIRKEEDLLKLVEFYNKL
jgi:hypothetical protein